MSPGNVIGGWIYSTPTSLGYATVASGGTVTFTIPSAIATGSHSIAFTSGGKLLGWIPIEITAPSDGITHRSNDGLSNTGSNLGQGIAVGLLLLVLGGIGIGIGTAARRRAR